MLINIKIKLISLVVCILLMFMISSCEDQMPQEFQEEKGFTISGVDSRACHLLSRSLFKTDTVISAIDTTDTTYNYTYYYIPDTISLLDHPFDTTWMEMTDEQISAIFDTLYTDTVMFVSNPVAEDTAYTFFQQGAGAPSKTYFFLSWEFDNSNTDAFIEVDVFRKDGERVRTSSSEVPLESVAGCTQEVEIAGDSRIIPTIRTRNVYSLTEGQYLIRFYISKPTRTTSFRVVVLQ